LEPQVDMDFIRTHLGKRVLYSTDKLKRDFKEYGLDTLRPVDQMLLDTGNSLIARKLVKKSSGALTWLLLALLVVVLGLVYRWFRA